MCKFFHLHSSVIAYLPEDLGEGNLFYCVDFGLSEFQRFLADLQKALAELIRCSPQKREHHWKQFFSLE